MVMTTQPLSSTKVKEKYSYTSTPPMALHGLFYGRFYLYFTYLQHITQQQ